MERDMKLLSITRLTGERRMDGGLRTTQWSQNLVRLYIAIL